MLSGRSGFVPADNVRETHRNLLQRAEALQSPVPLMESPVGIHVDCLTGRPKLSTSSSPWVWWWSLGKKQPTFRQPSVEQMQLRASEEKASSSTPAFWGHVARSVSISALTITEWEASIWCLHLFQFPLLRNDKPLPGIVLCLESRGIARHRGVAPSWAMHFISDWHCLYFSRSAILRFWEEFLWMLIALTPPFPPP